MMALRSAKLGVSSRWRRRIPVTGQVRLPCASHRSMQTRSYVCPVATITGSAINSCKPTQQHETYLHRCTPHQVLFTQRDKNVKRKKRHQHCLCKFVGLPLAAKRCMLQLHQDLTQLVNVQWTVHACWWVRGQKIRQLLEFDKLVISTMKRSHHADRAVEAGWCPRPHCT